MCTQYCWWAPASANPAANRPECQHKHCPASEQTARTGQHLDGQHGSSLPLTRHYRSRQVRGAGPGGAMCSTLGDPPVDFPRPLTVILVLSCSKPCVCWIPASLGTQSRAQLSLFITPRSTLRRHSSETATGITTGRFYNILQAPALVVANSDSKVGPLIQRGTRP